MVLNGHEIIILLTSILGSGAGVTLFAQLLKKLFRLKVSSVIHLFVVAITAIAAGAQYVFQLKSIPPDVLGISGPAIYGVSQFIYKDSKYVKDFLLAVAAKSAITGSTAAPSSSTVTTPTPSTSNNF